MSDDFDCDGTRSQSRRGGTMQVWDMLAILVLIITVCLAGYFVWIFLNPQSSFNFLPPASNRIPTLTPTPIGLEPTWTASHTLVLTPSNTQRPTLTPFFTNTQGVRVAYDTINADQGLAKDFLRKNQFVDADLTLTPSGLAIFTYDGRTISVQLNGWTGIAGGNCVFGARTGGATDNQWIDDLSIVTKVGPLECTQVVTFNPAVTDNCDGTDVPLPPTNDIEPGKEYKTITRRPNPIILDGNLSEWTGVPVLADPKFSIPKGSGSAGTYVQFEEFAGGT